MASTAAIDIIMIVSRQQVPRTSDKRVFDAYCLHYNTQRTKHNTRARVGQDRRDDRRQEAIQNRQKKKKNDSSAIIRVVKLPCANVNV